MIILDDLQARSPVSQNPASAQAKSGSTSTGAGTEKSTGNSTGVGTADAPGPKRDKKSKVTEWSAETKDLPEVKQGRIKLNPQGNHADCLDCGSSHKMQRQFDDYNLRSILSAIPTSRRKLQKITRCGVPKRALRSMYFISITILFAVLLSQ